MRRIAPFLLAACLLAPAKSAATAGFAESHSTLRYGDRASLHWIHPGDGCDCGPYCFQLLRADSRFEGFRGLERSLSKINVPAETGPPLVFAQACADEHWIVYDLDREEYLADTPSFDEALGVWKQQGLHRPHFAEAAHGAQGLHRTWSSFTEDTVWTGLMWLPMAAMLAVPLGMFASLVMLLRWRRSKRGADLAWCLFALLPALSFLGLVIAFGFRSGSHPGH